MTKTEAIDILQDYKEAGKGWDVPELLEALDMAIEALKEQTTPTIPMFKESEEAYKAWTGEEMGKTSDEINEMNKEIIKDILKMMPTAYLLEALGVDTFEELMEQADRPHGEWSEMGENEDGTHNIKCNQCGQGYQTRGHAHSLNTRKKYKFCPSCGAWMGGEDE